MSPCLLGSDVGRSEIARLCPTAADKRTPVCSTGTRPLFTNDGSVSRRSARLIVLRMSSPQTLPSIPDLRGVVQAEFVTWLAVWPSRDNPTRFGIACDHAIVSGPARTAFLAPDRPSPTSDRRPLGTIGSRVPSSELRRNRGYGRRWGTPNRADTAAMLCQSLPVLVIQRCADGRRTQVAAERVCVVPGSTAA